MFPKLHPLSPNRRLVKSSNKMSLATSHYAPVTTFNDSQVGLILMFVQETSDRHQQSSVPPQILDPLKTTRTPTVMSTEVSRLNALMKKSAITRQLLHDRAMKERKESSSERTPSRYSGRTVSDTVCTQTPPASPRVSSASPSNARVASFSPKKALHQAHRRRTASDAKRFFRNLKSASTRKVAAQNMIKLSSPIRVKGEVHSTGLLCHRIGKQYYL